MAYEYIIFPSLNPEANRSATTQAATMTQELATHLPLYAAASWVINPHTTLGPTGHCALPDGCHPLATYSPLSMSCHLPNQNDNRVVFPNVLKLNEYISFAMLN